MANETKPAREFLDTSRKYTYIIMLATTVWALYLPIPVWIHMSIMTTCIIYLGCHGSITKALSEDAEVMETKKAMMLPLIMSGVILSLYIVFKFLDKKYINILIKGYFCLFGVFVLGQHFARLIAEVLPEGVLAMLEAETYSFTIPEIPYLNEKTKETEEQKKEREEKEKKEEKEGEVAQVPDDVVEFNKLDLLGLVVGLMVAAGYLITNHWACNNIFGAFFSIEGIEMLNLGSYLNGAILLSGLFLYDIFWVFGTDVMVTVAKGFDGPIKLLFPNPGVDAKPSMLGLGDIVVPGIFIALILRFDVSLTSDKDVKSSPRLYFKSVMAAYLLGLWVTVAIMYWFEAAQPALLYLVPACLGTSVLVGATQGQLKLLFAYEESKDQAKDEKTE